MRAYAAITAGDRHMVTWWHDLESHHHYHCGEGKRRSNRELSAPLRGLLAITNTAGGSWVRVRTISDSTLNAQNHPLVALLIWDDSRYQKTDPMDIRSNPKRPPVATTACGPLAQDLCDARGKVPADRRNDIEP